MAKPKSRAKSARPAPSKAKKAPAPAPAAMPGSVPSPTAPSAVLSRSIKFPGQPVGGGTLASLLMG